MNLISFLVTPSTKTKNRSEPFMRRPRLMSVITITAAVLLAILSGMDVLAEGIILEVTGGNADVENWIAEATLDLATASQLLGQNGKPTQVTVHEITGEGTTVTKSVPSQVDHADDKNMYIVSWHVPETLAAGMTRRFLVRFDAPNIVEAVEPTLRVTTDKNTVTVTNGNISLEHLLDIGGMIRRVTVADTTGTTYTVLLEFEETNTPNKNVSVIQSPLVKTALEMGARMIKDDKNPTK